MRKRLLLGAALLTLACHGRPKVPQVAPITHVWTTRVDGLLDGPLATDGERFFVSTREGGVWALERLLGKVRWRSPSGPARLVARSDLVILREEGGRVARLNAESGEVVWEKETGNLGTLAPVLYGERVLIAGEKLTCLDVATGDLVWSAEDASYPVSCPPAALLGRVVVGESDGTLRCRDATSGRTLWTQRTVGPLLATPAIDESGHVYVGTSDRRVAAFSVKTGRQSWRWRVGTDVAQPPVLLGPWVYAVSNEGVLYALLRKSGDMDWRALLPSRPASPPLPLGGAVLVACRERDVAAGSETTERVESPLLAVDGTNGAMIATVSIPGEIVSPPVILGDSFYVGLRNPLSTVICFRMNVTLIPPRVLPSSAPKRRK